MARILVFNGSPKGERSDTMHITRAFLRGMEQAASQQIEEIRVIEKHIEYCTGCFTCMRNGGTCIHRDDMQAILEKILQSDILLFSFPLYCYGMPAPLKALIERTLPLSSMAMRKVEDRYEHVEQEDFSHLKYVMLSGCGFPGRENNFEPAVLQFQRMFGKDSTILTVAESPLFNVPSAECVTHPYLKLVEQAGEAYARTGEIPAALHRALAVPMIPENMYVKIANGEK